MPILGCGAELARVMAVADSDVQAIEDHLERLTKAGVPQQEAQRLAVSRLIEDLQVSSRAAQPEPAAAVSAQEPAATPQAVAVPASAAAQPEAQPDPLYSRSAIKSVDANVRRGEDAMNRALVEKADVNRAMYRSDLGWVDFVWGDAKRGLQHIIARRMSEDGMSEAEATRLLTNDLVRVIAQGETIRRNDVKQASRLVIEHGGAEAILVRNNSTNGWLLSGYIQKKKGKTGDAAAGDGAISATLTAPTRFRGNVGAASQEIVPPAPDLGIPRAEAEAAVDRYKRYGLKRVTLVESPADLPQDGRKRIESEGIAGVRGMYSPAEDMVYLVRQNIADGEDLLFTTLHEAFHRGLRKTIPSVGPVLDQIYLTNPSVRAEADRYAAEHGMSRQEATEEVLADMAGRGEARDLKGWDRLAKTIREWLDRIGRAVGVQMSWTDEMIQDLVAGARDAGLKADMQQEQGDARMNRGTTPPVANPQDVAGNQGGRPAGDNTDGASRPYLVDEKGKPLVLHHGTAADFEAFDLDADARDVGGIWFSDSKNYAYDMAGGGWNIPPTRRRKGRVISARIHASNPKTIDVLEEGQRLADEVGVPPPEDAAEAQQLLSGSMSWDEVVSDMVSDAKREGHDVLVIRNFDDGRVVTSTAYVVFSPDQIEQIASESPAPNRDGAPTFSRGGNGGPRTPAQRDLEYEPNPWNTPEPTSLDRMIYEIQDAKIDLKRVQEAIEKTGQKIEEGFDARMAETLYAGRVAKRHQDFLNVEVKPLLEAMARNGVSMDELSDFLLARHAPERNAQIAKVNPDLQDGGAGTNSKGDLMTTAAAEQYIEDLSPARRTLLQMLARQVDGITKGTRDVLVQEGLESAETVAAWQGAYAHYVPLFRDEAQEGDAPAMNQRTAHSQGSGFSVRGTSSKRAVGSTKEVTNMLAHVLMQREAAMTRAEKNRVGMALYGLALSAPNPSFWTVIRPDMSDKQIQSELERMGIDPLTVSNMEAAPTVRTVNPVTNTVETRTNPMYRTMANALTLKVGGEDRVIMFNEMDPRAARLAEALKNMDGVTRLDLAGNIVGKSTRWLASVNTQYNPAFGIVNAVRDGLGAAVNLGSTPLRGQGVRVLADTPRALAGIAAHLSGKKGGEWAKLYEQFQDDGAQTGFKELFRDANERTRRIEKELEAAQRDGTLTPARAAHAALDLLDGFNTTMENGVRLAAYKAALDKGMSRPAAAKLARELTVDFNRKGRAGRELGPLYAFFNASVQGSARTLQALAGPTGKRILIGGLALGVLQSMMLAGAGYEEDEISEFVKTRNFIIPLGDKKWAAIPLPLGLHVLPNTGRVLTDLALGDRKDASKQLSEAFGEILGAFNPLGGGNVLTADGAMKTIAPTVLDPLVELAANKNFAGAPIEKRYDEQRDNRPGHTRARESTQRTLTGQAYIGISKAINTLTGGTDYEAGLASPSPERVRYLTQTVGGGLLRELEKTVNLATPSDNSRETNINAVPLVARFTGRIDDRQVQQGRYTKNVERAEKLESSMKAAENAGDGAAAREMAKRPDARIIQATNEVQSEIAKLNKLAVQTINSPEKLRRIDEARYQAQLRLNEAIRKLETERAK